MQYHFRWSLKTPTCAPKNQAMLEASALWAMADAIHVSISLTPLLASSV